MDSAHDVRSPVSVIGYVRVSTDDQVDSAASSASCPAALSRRAPRGAARARAPHGERAAFLAVLTSPSALRHGESQPSTPVEGQLRRCGSLGPRSAGPIPRPSSHRREGARRSTVHEQQKMAIFRAIGGCHRDDAHASPGCAPAYLGRQCPPEGRARYRRPLSSQRAGRLQSSATITGHGAGTHERNGTRSRARASASPFRPDRLPAQRPTAPRIAGRRVPSGEGRRLRRRRLLARAPLEVPVRGLGCVLGRQDRDEHRA